MKRAAKTRSFTSRAASMLLCFALLFSGLSLCASAKAVGRSATPTIVKIGYYYDGDYMYKTSSGAYSGYDIEYFCEIAKYANWKYEFVDFNSFEEASAALEAGKIDIVPAFFYSEERAKKFLFSADDMGTIYVTLIVPEDDTTHAYKDYASFQGMKVGVLSGSLDGENFKSWAVKMGMNIEITELPTENALFHALDSGQIDAIAITYLGASSNYRVIAEFDPMRMFFAMPKKNTTLMAELNNALEQITIVNPAFKPNLFNKYWLVNQTQAPVFTKEEKAAISGSRTLTVALQRNNAPFSFEDKSGKMTGAVPDLFERLSQLSGLKFSFLPVDTQTEEIAAVQSGRADIGSKMADDTITAAAQGIRLTNPYMELAVTRVARKGTNGIHSIAVPSSLSLIYKDNSVSSDEPRQVLYYDTTAACFAALREGKVDAAFLDTVSTNYLMNINRASDYTIMALNGYSYQLSMGMSELSSGKIFSILNKCIRYTSASTMNELVIKYSQVGNESLNAFIDRIPTAYLIIFFGILSAAVLFLIILLFVLHKRANEEKLLAEQTAALTAVEKASSEKTEFLGSVSHDMRTPLNGILGYSELALQANDLTTVRSYLGKIRISGKLLLDLVNDTLTISKIENRKFELHPTVVKNSELTENVLTPIRTAADAKGVRLKVDAARAYTGYVRVDRLAWQKIFINLLTNAVKFTPPEGSVTFVVETLDPPEHGCGERMIVQGTGIGMDESFLPKMFDPFSQERPASLSNAGGTGLGLSIVKHFVDIMGGTIAVESCKGEGSRFTVCLPLDRVSEYTPESEEHFDGADFAGLKILLCEDNDMNAEITQSILEAKKMQVVWAKNGREGTELFSASKPDEYAAILMDIRMPVMNGYEAARAIRALDRPDAPGIPIIALSADAFDEDIKKALAAGMNAHVAKPIDSQLLYAELRQLLN